MVQEYVWDAYRGSRIANEMFSLHCFLLRSETDICVITTLFSEDNQKPDTAAYKWSDIMLFLSQYQTNYILTKGLKKEPKNRLLRFFRKRRIKHFSVQRGWQTTPLLWPFQLEDIADTNSNNVWQGQKDSKIKLWVSSIFNSGWIIL